MVFLTGTARLVRPKALSRSPQLLLWGGAFAGIAALSTRSFSFAGLAQAGTHGLNFAANSIRNPAVAFLRRHGTATSLPTLFPTVTQSMLTPPQAPPKWTHSPADVLDLVKAAIEKDRVVEDTVGALKPADCTFESVRDCIWLLAALIFNRICPIGLCECLQAACPTPESAAHIIHIKVALESSGTQIEVVTEPLLFYQNVSPSKELRDASVEADSLLREYGVESSMRIDVFQAKIAAEKNLKESGSWDKLSAEDKRLVEKMILDGTRAGLHLPEDKRDALKALQKELSQVCLEFEKNFNEENGVISFTAQELEGVPADVISGYKKRTEGETELYDVTYKTPDIFPIFKFANNPETRKRAYQGHESRLEVNVPLTERFLALRRKISSTLGYANWAEYRTEPKMVKSAKGVQDFLDDLESKLKPLGINDRKVLLALKEKDCAARQLDFDGSFNIWDYRYYDRKFTEETLDLDDMLVKEYFPVSVVVPRILDIYQTLLGVRNVRFLNCSQMSNNSPSGRKMPRMAAASSGTAISICSPEASRLIFIASAADGFAEAKYSHAAVWSILSGYTRSDGSRSYPLTAMVANLAKSTPDKPALMRHDDVVTLFHEMGHVFHGLLSQTKFARFHGTKVARDFVEAPSQMLENWCWEPEVLSKMSSHYKTQEPLSEELITKLLKSRYVNVGLQYLRQVFFAKFDIKVHIDQEAEDYTQLWDKMREEISLVKADKPCPGQVSPASFGHIASGYDAGYYGYLYSLVFASDMYATVFKGDPLDPARGQLYRKKILVPGGSREELDSLQDFLGRPPSNQAFLQELFGSNQTNANL
ncbi:unnamed protein product [Mycena citricolor]|uniref:Peptidase M3A/M3B catalytic domain-containing protein n=1 Tax=Mycena citricolor TaxID=2018698 RepID=A0AAD2HZM6_9AGAR|nr:unnamed protein product [Mycena citricolor]CAK5284224.1 unnamed protein product [Mycena citricolor]